MLPLRLSVPTGVRVLDLTPEQPPARRRQRGGPRQRTGAIRRWTPPPTAPRRLLSLNDTAAYLGVSPWTVRELQWKGKLPRVRISHRLLFDRGDLDRLIEREKDTPTP